MAPELGKSRAGPGAMELAFLIAFPGETKTSSSALYARQLDAVKQDDALARVLSLPETKMPPTRQPLQE